jgi:hypothetical protein
MTRTRVCKQIAVFRASTLSGAPADCYLDATEAARVVRNGDGRRINHGRAIRLRPGLKTIEARSAECLPQFKAGAGWNYGRGGN